MGRVELYKLALGSKVKLTPQGKTYEVIMSKYRGLLWDEQGNQKKVSPMTSVYVMSRG